jgi:hypothetical protein
LYVTVQYRPLSLFSFISPSLPLRNVFHTIIRATNYGYSLMSTELLSSPKLDSNLQKSNDDEEDNITKNMMIQQEIECPRCYDVMSNQRKVF